MGASEDALIGPEDDELGRDLRTTGTPVSRIIFNHYPKMLTWGSTTAWDFDGGTGWGENQDCWRPDQWSAYRRTLAESRGTP